MSPRNLLEQCLTILYSINDDRSRLEKLLEFMRQEFGEEDVDTTVMVDHLAQIPLRYHALIKEIASNMSGQLISFVDIGTLEVDFIPRDVEYMDIDEQVSISDWEDRIRIEPLDSHDSYETMENFVAQLPNNGEKRRLLDAVDGYKPFANFNRIIHQSELREQWFEFRQRQLEKYVIENYLDIIIGKK